MTNQQIAWAKKQLLLRQALKNARRTRRALWNAYPISDRIDFGTGEMLLRSDLLIAELLGRIDGHKRPH